MRPGSTCAGVGVNNNIGAVIAKPPVGIMGWEEEHRIKTHLKLRYVFRLCAVPPHGMAQSLFFAYFYYFVYHCEVETP